MPKKYVYKSREKTLTYNKENMLLVYDEVKNGRMSVRKAADQFNVPKSSLQDR